MYNNCVAIAVLNDEQKLKILVPLNFQTPSPFDIIVPACIVYSGT